MFRGEIPSCLQVKIVTPALLGPRGKNIVSTSGELGTESVLKKCSFVHYL